MPRTRSTNVPNAVTEHRNCATDAQLKVLEAIFEKDTNPNASQKNELAVELGMTVTKVKVWFQNRRAKEKKLSRVLEDQRRSKPRKTQTPIVTTLKKGVKLIGPSERPQPLTPSPETWKTRKSDLEGDKPYVPRQRKHAARKASIQQDATTLTSRASEHSRPLPPTSVVSSSTQSVFEVSGLLGSRNNSRTCSPADAILDPFNSSADLLSEANIKASLEALNYVIHNTISNMCHQFNSKTTHKRFKPRPRSSSTADFDASQAGPMEPVFLLLLSPDILKNPSRDLILDALLHDKVCNLIYEAFFDGETFYGVDPQTREILDQLYSSIRKQGMEAAATWRIAQRWRSISISAAFDKQGESIINSLNDALLEALELIFGLAYPSTSPSFHKMISDLINEAKQALHEIICMAHRLSLQIQKDLISCQMKVTVAPQERHGLSKYHRFDHAAATSVWDSDIPSKQGDPVLGTFKFGLDRISEIETKSIILPEVITKALLRHCGRTGNPV